MKVGVIGIGYWGKKHVEEYHELGHDVIICDNDEENISACKEKFPFVNVESLDKLLAKRTTSKFALATIYNTVHAFKKAGHLSEVEVRGKKTYFDTNITNHHHFYDSENCELIDIDANDVVIQKIPKAPNGKKIKNVEVFINLKN